MPGLWRKQGKKKYPVVMRRDGTIPSNDWFVLLDKDPWAPFALRSYASEAERRGADPEYVADVRALANEWEDKQRSGVFSDEKRDPCAPPHRQEDAEAVSFPASLREYRGQLLSSWRKEAAGNLRGLKYKLPRKAEYESSSDHAGRLLDWIIDWIDPENT